MINVSRFLTIPFLVISFLLTALPQLALAQTIKLEEIVVTAQLREESLQDVSVSVSALSRDKLFDSGLNKIEDLQVYVPNFDMSETGIGTNLYIRGIGSGINQGFEQSVGMYVDGVYYGRAQLSRAPFLDLQRVEVLRGPQSTLLGKNSIAGALNITTNKPGDEFEGLFSILSESKHDERIYDLVLSGPITGDLSARLAFRERDIEGYINNTTLNRDEPKRDEQTLRLMLDWQISDSIDSSFKYERSTFDVVGRQVEIVVDQPSLNPALGGANYAQTLLLFSGGTATSALDTVQDFNRSANGDFSDNETDNVTLTLNGDIDQGTFTSITSYLAYEYNELCDCDFTGADVFFVQSQEDFDQFSQEFRFTSNTGGAHEYIVGLYYQKSDLDFDDQFFTTPTTVLGAVPALAGIPISDLAAPRQFRQDSDLWSVFAQWTWHLSDVLRLTLGGRYDNEEKDGSRTLTFVNGTTGTPIGLAGQAGIAAVLVAENHNLRGSRSEDNFSPLLTVEYDATDELMLYFSATQGFKAGGFDARSNLGVEPIFLSAAQAGTFEYEDEQATSFELGAKTTLADGAAELNVAIFRTEYEDLQISIFDGTLGFNVGNAAKADSQGIELDGRWRVHEYVTLASSLAYLDFEFDEFANGQCSQLIRLQTTATQCDFSGETNQYVADFNGVFSVNLDVPLNDKLVFASAVDIIYRDDYNPSQNIDPIIEQDSYTKVNARVAIATAEETWEIALIGKNLTDEEIITYANDTPLSASLFGSVGHYAFLERPRTVALQGVVRF